MAGVWSVRTEPLATISTPISREDLENDIEPTDFTLKKPERDRHQLWEDAMAKPVAIEKILLLAEPEPKARGVDKKRKRH